MLEQSDFQGLAAPAQREPAWRAGAIWRETVRIWSGIAIGLRSRIGVFLAVAAGILALEVLVPPAVLSVARRPVDYFTFNPWLPELPRFLAAGDVTWQRKLDFLPGLALFWFSADSPFGGTDWGFAVTVSDLLRFIIMALLFAAFFALLAHRAREAGSGRPDPGLGRKGGAIGVVASALGFSTGGCTVVGCGAPVIPVVGLAFVGLSSGTLALLAQLSRVATAFVLVAFALGVIYLGWRIGKSVSAGN
jgi:hypothetical protein